jgi:hypothetical protein
MIGRHEFDSSSRTTSASAGQQVTRGAHGRGGAPRGMNVLSLSTRTFNLRSGVIVHLFVLFVLTFATVKTCLLQATVYSLGWRRSKQHSWKVPRVDRSVQNKRRLFSAFKTPSQWGKITCILMSGVFELKKFIFRLHTEYGTNEVRRPLCILKKRGLQELRG